jgi:hypothetical protein
MVQIVPCLVSSQASGYEAVVLLDPGPELLPIWVQWWVLADPAGALGDDGDEVGDADVDVVRAVVAVALVLPADASATPAPPAPSPAATMPVMMSRRARPPVADSIEIPPFPTAAADRDVLVVRDQPARPFCATAPSGLSVPSELRRNEKGG